MLETREAATRPRRSRLLGICYLLYFVLAISSALFTLPGVAAIGLALSLTSTVLYAIVAVLFYLAFKPVDKAIAATAAVLGVAGCVITIFNDFGFAPASAPLLAFGPFCIVIGILILRSTIVPWAFGVLMVAAGICWLAFLVPPVASALAAPIKIVGFVSELALMVWLLVAGIEMRAPDAPAGER